MRGSAALSPFPPEIPCWALSQERKSCWLVNDWVFVRRDRTKNLEDKTSGGREGARGMWRQEGRGGEAEVQEGFLVPPLEQKISLKLVTAPTAFICCGSGSSQISTPTLNVPPAPLGSVHYHRCLSGTRDWERHCFPDVPSETHLAVKCSSCISTLWKVGSKHRQGHSHHYKLLDVSFARPVALWQNVE